MDIFSESSLYQILDEQVAFFFTGRINILQKSNIQLVGEIVLEDGFIIYCQFVGVIGVKALCYVFLHDHEKKDLKFVVEPEIVAGHKKNIGEKFPTLMERITPFLKEALRAVSLRPSPHIKLQINSNFISREIDLKGSEFDVLCSIADYPKVADIYKYCILFDYEITTALVALRKMKAIMVVDN